MIDGPIIPSRKLKITDLWLINRKKISKPTLESWLSGWTWGQIVPCEVCGLPVLVDNIYEVPSGGVYCYKHSHPTQNISIEPFVLGDSYLENDYVLYTHTSGELNSIEMSYILRAKNDLPDYDTFDLNDWEIVSNKVWLKDRAAIVLEKFDIFPGDTIVLNSEDKLIYNVHSGIIKSDVLLSEFDTVQYRQLGFGGSSIQIKTGLNIFYVELPIIIDELSFGLVDNSIFNGKAILNILYDNAPDDFEVYFKVKCVGDPTIRTTYPEITNYFSITWKFVDLDIIELSDFSIFDYQGYPITKPSFTANGDFRYYKFFKTPSLDKIQFQELALNTTPDLFP